MRLVVARIGRAHGLHGEVTVETRTDSPQERFVAGATFFVVPPPPAASTQPRQPQQSAGQPPRQSSGQPSDQPGQDNQPPLPAQVTLRSMRDHNGVALLSFEGIDSRTAAERLRGIVLEADLAEDSGEDEAWYDHQLVGLRVLDVDDVRHGVIAAVDHLPAQDLLVVTREDGQQRLVPFVRAIVPEVNIRGGFVRVTPPPGLLHDHTADAPSDPVT
jgi:16S rRNA processing protein RimM